MLRLIPKYNVIPAIVVAHFMIAREVKFDCSLQSW